MTLLRLIIFASTLIKQAIIMKKFKFLKIKKNFYIKFDG